MKTVLFLLIALLFSGCSVIVEKDNELQYFGIRPEEAMDTLKKIDEKKPEEKHQLFLSDEEPLK